MTDTIAYATVGRGGTSIHFDTSAEPSTSSRHLDAHWLDPARCVAEAAQRGYRWPSDAPLINTQTIADEAICRFAIAGPIPYEGLPAGHVRHFLADTEPFEIDVDDPLCGIGSCDQVAIDLYVTIAEHFGATITYPGQEAGSDG